jgi:hypothetical protein
MSDPDTSRSSEPETATDGPTVFFPFGMLGRGYVVSTAERASFTQWTQAWTFAGLIAVLICGRSLGYLAGFVAFAAWAALYAAWAHYAVRGLPVSDERLSPKRAAQKNFILGSSVLTSAWLWAAAIITAALTIFGIVDLFFLEPDDVAGTIFMTVVFALCTIAFGYTLAQRLRA